MSRKTILLDIKDARTVARFREHFEDIRSSFAGGAHRYITDLRHVDFLDLPTLLLLWAWSDSIRLEYPKATLLGKHDRHSRLRSDMAKIGIYRALPPEEGLRNFPIDPFGTDTVFAACENTTPSTVNIEPQHACSVASVCNPYISDKEFDLVSAAVNEAILNAKHWAYQYTAIEKHLRKWWVVARMSVERREFSIAFYDQGIGLVDRFLSKRVGQHGVIASVLGLGEDASDGEKLRAAFRLTDDGVRQLIPDGRGRGLGQMRDLGGSFRSGTFAVRTGKAIFAASHVSGKPHIGGVRDTIFELPGTLLSWKLRF